MYDYVIVGGGSAGCVLAARLSENPDARILLLEAGRGDSSRYIQWPGGFFRLNIDRVTWGYRTAPQPHAAGREIPIQQARIIGGGSSINAEVFTRGCKQDYDSWAHDLGCSGWSFAELRPWFLRLEDNDTLGGQYHGSNGPVGISTQSPQKLTRAFVEACEQAGIPYTDDFNGAQQAGAGFYQTTTRHVRRCSAAVAYLAPARDRPNLEIRLNCHSRRILMEHGRAVGVEYTQNGRLHRVRAVREVVVAAGAIGSPKLLLLSGIGPADHLRRVGVEVMHDLPGVGRNLHDHYATDTVYELTGPWSFDRYTRRHWMLLAGLQYALFRTGPAASNVVEGGAFWQVDPDSTQPDTQLHFVAASGMEDGVRAVPAGSGCRLNAYQLRPFSRGSLTLRSADPRDPPVIDPNYLADPRDLGMAVGGVKLMRDIMAQPALRRFIRRECGPGAAARSDAELEAFVRQRGHGACHPVGTCRMGSDALAVVDPELHVHGIEGLRVCDSSVMPQIVSANTNVPTIMIAERGSDLIRMPAQPFPGEADHAVRPARMPAAELSDASPAGLFRFAFNPRWRQP
ncbi:L-sorbose 1-dehydrogenase [Rhodovastum atsumiense]|uniref:FAD-dependent oxidoreductase n=1 Tax=Rhodovastum atsumiense TaxID=504468 RepID=A0A5M6J1Z1_9PROT|nr:FAD-dependent oxidoreductase [Rhodovastum atsumiense]KAA5613645.1 FAD-dependent oxidoreductase [Rhodovastum atsumiense]CAH2599552.1 L-sorbose 1-dehydrogenase [Rhodovastum atsumiense]